MRVWTAQSKRISDLARGVAADLRLFTRTIRLITDAARGSATFYMLFVVLIGILPASQAWFAKLVVNGLVDREGSRAMLFGVFYIVALSLPAALDPILNTLSAGIEDRTVAEIDHRLMHAATRLSDLVRIERPEYGDDLFFVQYSVYAIASLQRGVRQAGGGIVTLAALMFLLGGLHPLIPIALIAVTIPHLRAEKHVYHLKYKTMGRQSRPAREMDYCLRVATDLDTAKEVRVFGLGTFLLSRYRERSLSALKEVRRIRLLHLRTSFTFGLLYALTLAGSFWYVATSVNTGRLSLGDLALYLSVLVQTVGSLRMLSYWLGEPYEALQYLRKMFEFVDGAKPSIAVPAAGQGHSAPHVLRQGVELCNISFAYPEQDQSILRDVSFKLKANEITALVGANGVGKSTIVKLLTRMYAPTGGEILLEGVPLHEYNLDLLRRRIAVVYQDFARFALTLTDNIGVGNLQAGEDAVEMAALRSGADEIAHKLSHGYDTGLTRLFESGVDLSGGEWQKVALARAFVRDAALVILDEPTAALDADAEYHLFQSFKELMVDKTALIISHRFSTVKMADQIVVLDDGRVLETGSHSELLSEGGRYAQLFGMQAGQYR